MDEKEFNELMERIKKATSTEVATLVSEALKGLDPDKLKDVVSKELATKEDFDKLNTLVEEAKEAVNDIKDSHKANLIVTAEKQIKDFVKENFEEIKRLKTVGAGEVSFEIKVPETVTTGSATNPDGIPELVGVQLAPPSDVNLRSAIIASLVTTIATDMPTYAYTETLPKDGDFEFVGEGEKKPQMDFKIETRYAEPKKIAAWIQLTDEAVEDIRGMQSIATNLLRKKHDLKKDRAILFGAGTGNEPTGATVYARVFNAGAMAGEVANPNFMDIVNAVITDVFTTHNYQDETPYLPSLVLINPVDFFLNLVSAKDGNGSPLYPQATIFNRVTIGSVTIIPDESIPAGKIFVADMSKYNITDYIGYRVRIGWINEDFIHNQFIILGESRFHAFVKKLDEQAFVYDDIATIKAAIEKTEPEPEPEP